MGTAAGPQVTAPGQPRRAALRRAGDADIAAGCRHHASDPLPGHLRPRAQPHRGVWSHLKRGLGNCAATGVDQLVALVKTRLKRLQYHPALLAGFLGQTGLTLEPVPP